ncbi:MAG: hypothetical protein V4625_19060 [Pseudomonadota bacterium]
MLSDIKFHRFRASQARRFHVFSAALVMASAGLTACGTTGLPIVAYRAEAAAVPAVAAPQPPQVLVVAPPPDATVTVLAYADKIRTLQGADLQQEIARLGDAPTPEDQLRLAVALIQTRQLYDLVRAQDLLQRVLANAGSDARPLHPLARLLAARFTEQRRAEDQLDRQGQQLRDALRRLDQTNDKLEALKEIERSLTPRAATPAPAAAASRSRNRPATP